MERVNEYFRAVEHKMKQLVEDHQKTKTERDQLINQTVILKKKTEEQKEEIEKLTSQVRALQIARTVGSSEDTARVKGRIQDLVREIDRCIELLNK